MRVPIRLDVAAATLLALPSASIAQAPAANAPPAARRFSVSGEVVGARGERIAGAQIRLASRPNEPLAAVTGDDGAFRITGLAFGNEALVVRRLGFAADTIPFQVPLPPRVPLTVVLTPAAQPLAPVVVRADLRIYRGPFAEFNRRRDRGFGTFVTQAEIARRRPSRVSDIFRTVSNLRVERASTGTSVVRMRGRSCDPLVWVDGVPLVGGFPDLDAVPPQSIEGIEIYNGVATIPPELIGPREAGGCGVIVVWSRHGEPRRKHKASKPVTTTELAALVDSDHVFTADQVDTPAIPMPGYEVDPAYPDAMRAASVPGQVLVEFVVDADGLVERETVGVISSNEPVFAEAVKEAAPSARFVPAVRRGSRVRQLVQVPVRFAPVGATTVATPAPAPSPE
jgi:TonB family protein